MRTALPCLAVVVVVTFPCHAQQTTSPPQTLIRLSVQPAAAPRPALRYLLLPELNEMNPGNPIQNYFKCFMEQQKFFFDKEEVERREKLLVMPLAELPATELRNYGGFALRQADWAARLDTSDWQLLLKVKTDGVSMLIPEVQQLRAILSPLKVRFRAEVALGRFDDAIRTAKTMFALARHLGGHPTLVGNLVGCSAANMAIGSLDEMFQQPGCPNLYWALTNLPTPLVPLDKGIEGERALVLAEFRDLHPNAAMSSEQLKTFIAYMDILLGGGTPLEGSKGVQAWLEARTKDEVKVSAARRRLVESGMAEEPLRRFPAEQVILLDEKREFEVRRDDIMKTMTLPAWQAETVFRQAKPAPEPSLFTDVLLQAVYDTRLRQVRLDQSIAILRHVEALRLYAAEHQGALPAKLTETPVPLPDDPFTGKPFRYELNGTTAHLRGSALPSEGAGPAHSQAGNSWTTEVHYEVTIRK